MKSVDFFQSRADFYRQMADSPENDWNAGALLSLANMFEDLARGPHDRAAVQQFSPP